MIRLSFLCALLLSSLALYLHGAELTLSTDGWIERTGKDSKAVFTRANGEAVISVPVHRYARLEARCPADGTDDAPLRVETRISMYGEGALRGQAGQLTLTWPGGLLSVGVIPGDGATWMQRTAVARWVTGKERGEKLGTVALYPHVAPAFLRLLVSSRDVSAWASGDGWRWQRLVSFPRSGGDFAGAPSTVAIGTGWPEKEGTSLDVDHGDPDKAGTATYIFQTLRVVNEAAVLPSALLKTYTKGASREETNDQLQTVSLPHQWWLTGPFPARAAYDLTPIGPESGAFDATATFASATTKVGWKEHIIGEGLNDHIVMASAIIPGAAGQERFAATVIECDEPRMERFLFDGSARIGLYVNGRLMAYAQQTETQVDRHVVIAPLVKGRNTVVVAIASDDKGQSTFTLRHEPGDPRYRIALLKRLAIEFPEDSEVVMSDLLETARLWEHSGFIAEAAKASREIAAIADAPRDQAETALLERVRLHTELRDQAAIDADVELVKALWTSDTEATPMIVLQRTAQLWQRLDQPAKALAALGEASKLVTQDDEQSAVLGLERMRLVSAGNDPVATCQGIRDVASVLPATSVLRALLCGEIADRVLWSGQKDAGELAFALASTNPRALRRAAGVALGAKQPALWLTALKSLTALPASGFFDAPQVTLAEAQAASSDEKGAMESYRQAIVRLPGGEVPTGAGNESLNGLRSAFIRATLATSSAGTRLLATASKTPWDGGTPVFAARRWWTLGPVATEAYVTPPFNPEAIDLKKPVGTQTWVQQVVSRCDANGLLDLTPESNWGGSTMYCYIEIPAAAEGAATLLMACDGVGKVWMNGVKVYEDQAPHRAYPNSMGIPVTLKKGVNHLLCAVRNTGWGVFIQCRVADAGWPDSEIVGALRFAMAKPDQREDVASILEDSISCAYHSGRVGDAGALTRVLLSAFPERWPQGSAVAGQFSANPSRLNQDPMTAQQALMWMESAALLQPTNKDTAAWLGTFRRGCAWSLTQAGGFSVAVDLLHAAMWSSFDTLSQCQCRMVLAYIYRIAGYPEQSMRFYRSVQDTDGIDQLNAELAQQARAGIAELRRYNSVDQVKTISFDTTGAVRSAEEMAASKSYASAIASPRKLVIANPGQAVPQSGGRSMGLAAWYADHLRRMPAEDIANAHATMKSALAQQLADALSRDDLEALERVAIEYPLFPEAASALEHCARRYLALGADGLAAATVDHLVQDFTLAEPVRGELLVAALRAAVRAGDRGVFASLAKEFSTTAKPMVDGAAVDAKAWLAEAGKPLTVASDPAPVAAIGAATVALAPEQLRDTRRFVGDGERTVHVVPNAGIGSGLAYLNSGVDGVLLDLATGALRWRVPADRASISGRPDLGFGGLPEAGAIVSGGRCVARARREGHWCLEARDAASGTLSWSSELTPGLRGMSACSSPASDGVRAIAVFTDNEHLTIAAFTLSDGQLAWMTPLITRGTDLGLTGRAEWLFELAAPSIVGREGYVATDSGAVLSFDCGSGFLRWVATYSRVPDFRYEGGQVTAERIRRPPSRVLVGTDSVTVLPRNSLGLFCFSRSDGALRWRRDFPGERALTGLGLTAQGERIVMQGEDVQCLDGATGRTAWRWLPRDGVTIGSGAVGAASVAISTAASLHRLNLATGTLLGSLTWKELGITGSAPGNLRFAGDRLVASGNGGLAILAPAAKPTAGLPALVPGAINSGLKPKPVPIPTTGLAAAAPGAPLGLAWRFPCPDIVAMAHVEPGELYVQTRESFSRLDVLAPAMVWTTAVPADTNWMMIDGDAILAVGTSTMMLMGREDGVVRWCEPVGGFDPLSELGQGMDNAITVHLCENTVLTYMTRGRDPSFVDVRDRKTGKRIANIPVANKGGKDGMGVRLNWASEKGGKVSMLFVLNGKTAIEVHDLATGKLLVSNETAVDGYPTSTLQIPGRDGKLLVSASGAAAEVDAMTGVGRPLGFAVPQQLHGIKPYGDLLEIWGGDPQVRWDLAWTLWNSTSGKVVLQETVKSRYQLVGDRLVRAVWHPGGDDVAGMIGKALDGKQLWWTQTAGKWERNYLFMDANTTHAYSLFTNSVGEQAIEIFNVADGKMVASGLVPGTAVEAWGGSQLFGNTWVLACEKQVIGLVPSTPEAIAKLPVDQSLPVSQRHVRGLMRLPASGSVAVLPLSAARGKLNDPAEVLRWKSHQPLTKEDWDGLIDSPQDSREAKTAALAATWFADWSKMPAVELGSESTLVGSPAEAKVYAAYGVYGMCIAVEVADSTPYPRPAGGSPWSGDSVVVGLLNHIYSNPNPSSVVFALHDSDGQPHLDVIAGGWAADPNQEGQPIVKVVRGAGKQVYQVVIPWRLLALRGWGNKRLTTMGVAIIDRTNAGTLGVRTWGGGLMDGISPKTWPSVQFLSEK